VPPIDTLIEAAVAYWQRDAAAASRILRSDTNLRYLCEAVSGLAVAAASFEVDVDWGDHSQEDEVIATAELLLAAAHDPRLREPSHERFHQLADEDQHVVLGVLLDLVGAAQAEAVDQHRWN
jgi:hypothetical protein